MLTHMHIQITDNSSSTVEIYNDRGVISASDCNYTWGNSMHKSISLYNIN